MRSLYLWQDLKTIHLHIVEILDELILRDVSENDKKSLDEYEDYPYLYDCFEEKVLLENNETISGFIYQMYDRFPICKPSDSYMERCKQGYRDMGWDSSILDF